MPSLQPSDFRTAITLAEPAWPRGAWLEVFRIRRLLFSAYPIPIPGLPPALVGLRILHLTDPHIDVRWMPAWDELHDRLAASPPDLILITGDFVERKYDSRPAFPLLERFLGGLTARLGVWGILGNHDGDVLALALADMNVRLLANERVTLQSVGGNLELIGVQGVSPFDLSSRFLATLEPKQPGTLRLVMMHYPDLLERLVSLDGAVYFAGHTHGGQVCLPGGRPLMTHDRLPKRFAQGVHRIGDRWLSVGRGLGFSTYPIRTFCPADVAELTLTVAPNV